MKRTTTGRKHDSRPTIEAGETSISIESYHLNEFAGAEQLLSDYRTALEQGCEEAIRLVALRAILSLRAFEDTIIEELGHRGRTEMGI